MSLNLRGDLTPMIIDNTHSVTIICMSISDTLSVDVCLVL